MKRLSIVLMSLLALLVVVGPDIAGAADDGGMIAGAGVGVFPSGAMLAGVALSSMNFGQGVLTAPDGSATGTFHAVLLAASIPSLAVTVEGSVNAGSIAGIATFGGTATVDLGDGSPALQGVPFQVSLSPDGLQLALDATVLPTLTLSAGAIAME